MKKTKKLSRMGLLLAAALILSYIESLVPFFAGVPGMKAGLANLVVVLTLYLYGWGEALLINMMRIMLSGFLFGNLAGILFSLAGALLSFMVMTAVKKTGRFGVTGVSIAGGVFHNIGQLLIAAFVVKTSGILYYMAPLIIAGAVTGALIGYISAAAMPYINRIKERDR